MKKGPYSKWLEYESWLEEYVHAGVDGNYRNYKNLLHRLFVTPYIPYLDKDLNRVGDGINVRYIYGNANDLYKKYIRNELESYPGPRDPCFYDENRDRYCSMLEMMIGLSNRINETYFDPDSDKSYIWFWLMIESLGLKSCTDESFDGLKENNDVDIILNSFMHNTYDDHTGEGSLFPVKNTTEVHGNDKFRPKNVEIWKQMEHFYKIEYPILKNITEAEFDKKYLS